MDTPGHSIPLGHGIVTRGTSDTSEWLRRLGMPEDLSGKTVLDVGAWDGFYSFEAERRGAARVLATDHYCWSGSGWGTRAGFDLARLALDSNVEDLDIDVFDISRKTVGVFDIVLFLGVLYHLRHPLLALERIFDVTGEVLIIESLMDLALVKRPVLAFYPGSEVSHDPSNWWGANPAAIAALLRSAGFRKTKKVYQTPLSLRAGRALRSAVRGGALLEPLQQGRVVFHAWR